MFTQSNDQKSATLEQKATEAIEKNIQMIWLGSVLRPHHLDKISEWKKLNPSFKLTVWVEDQYVAEVIKQSNLANEIKPISSVLSSKAACDFFDKLTKFIPYHAPNYAAASDIARFYILEKFGGWYIDIGDVTAVALGKIKTHGILKFCVHRQTQLGFSSVIAPSVIGCTSKNLIAKKSIQLIEKMNEQLTLHELLFLRSSLASVRMAFTETTTGSLLNIALSKIKFGEHVLYDSKNSCVNPDIINSISYPFESTFEKSWLLDKAPKSINGFVAVDELKKLKGIQGVSCDAAYYKRILMGQPLNMILEEHVNQVRMSLCEKLKEPLVVRVLKELPREQQSNLEMKEQGGKLHSGYVSLWSFANPAKRAVVLNEVEPHSFCYKV